MQKKSNLLKELGWSDDLINHFMIEDNEYADQPQSELKTEVFDTNSLTISFNACSVGNAAVLKVNKK